MKRKVFFFLRSTRLERTLNMSTYLLPLLTVHVPCSHHEDFFLQLDWESVPVTFVGAFTTFMETVDFSLLGRCCHSSQQKWRPSIYQDDVNWGYKMGQSSHSNWKAKVSNRLSCRKDTPFANVIQYRPKLFTH